MQVHIFAMAGRQAGFNDMINYDTCVDRLTEPLAAIAREAIASRRLQSYRADRDEWWVSRAQLAAVAGFGRRLADPADPHFVPPEATLQVPYLPLLITEEVLAREPYQEKYLTAARHTANYLAALTAVQPPEPFDWHVYRTNVASPLLALIREGKLITLSSEVGWWISSNEAAKHLPDGESFTDDTSAWYIQPNDYSGLAELSRLTAAHRQNWPEVYDAGALIVAPQTSTSLSAPFPQHTNDWPGRGLNYGKIPSLPSS